MATQNTTLSPWILLAGGKSTRMGHPKGLLPIQKQTWLEFQLQRLEKYGQTRGVIVLGFAQKEYFQALPWLQEGKSGSEFGPEFCHEISRGGLNLKIVINPRPEFGPFSSIQAGIRALGTSPDGAYIQPIDTPCASSYVWTLLERTHSNNTAASAVIPCFRGKGGHPVRLSQNFLNQLLACPPDLPSSRLDHQIQILHPHQVIRVETEAPEILLNLNTSEDWNKVSVQVLNGFPLPNERSVN